MCARDGRRCQRVQTRNVAAGSFECKVGVQVCRESHISRVVQGCNACNDPGGFYSLYTSVCEKSTACRNPWAVRAPRNRAISPQTGLAGP